MTIRRRSITRDYESRSAIRKLHHKPNGDIDWGIVLVTSNTGFLFMMVAVMGGIFMAQAVRDHRDGVRWGPARAATVAQQHSPAPR